MLGLVGGARASVQLRSFLAAIGCISVSMMFNISNAHLALTEEGEPSHTEEVSIKFSMRLVKIPFFLLFRPTRAYEVTICLDLIWVAQ